MAGGAGSEIEEHPAEGGTRVEGAVKPGGFLVEGNVLRDGVGENGTEEPGLVFEAGEVIVGVEVEVPEAAAVGSHDGEHRVKFRSDNSRCGGGGAGFFPGSAGGAVAALGYVDEIRELVLVGGVRKNRRDGEGADISRGAQVFARFFCRLVFAGSRSGRGGFFLFLLLGVGGESGAAEGCGQKEKKESSEVAHG